MHKKGEQFLGRSFLLRADTAKPVPATTCQYNHMMSAQTGENPRVELGQSTVHTSLYDLDDETYCLVPRLWSLLDHVKL